MNRTFQSKLASYIEGLIRERQACGYLFNLYASHLFRFDSFIVENGLDNGCLDEPVFSAWAVRLETENQNSRNSRVHAVCELADYMECLGHNVFRPYRLGRDERTTPCIPAKVELERLFTFIDRTRVKNKEFERFNIEYPVLIRLYYHCGLRLNEAVMLRGIRRGTRTGLCFLPKTFSPSSPSTTTRWIANTFRGANGSSPGSMSTGLSQRPRSIRNSGNGGWGLFQLGKGKGRRSNR